MLKKVLSVFKSPKLDLPNMDLRASVPYMEPHVSQTNRGHQHNMEQYTSANLRLQRNALEQNLKIMHRTMIIAFVAYYLQLLLV